MRKPKVDVVEQFEVGGPERQYIKLNMYYSDYSKRKEIPIVDVVKPPQGGLTILTIGMMHEFIG